MNNIFLIIEIFILNIFFSECWDNEPDQRPTIHQVVDRLDTIIKKPKKSTNNGSIYDYKSTTPLSN